MVFLQTNMKWLFTNQWWIVSFPWLTEACPENRSYVKFCTFGMDGWTFRSHNWLFSSKKKIIWESKNSNVPSCQSLRKVFDFFRGGGGRAVQKIHALVHVCCLCVISVFDFVWLHHDCIMTASWQHHRIDLCGSNIMRKKTVVNATDAVLLQTTDSTFTFRNSKPFQRTWFFSIPRPNSS